MRSKTARFWIEILAMTSAIVCALGLFLATLGAAAGAASTEAEPGRPVQASTIEPIVYEGVVTDSRCGAKHSARVGMAASDCTRACVHGGERFALVDGDKAYTLEGGMDALKRVAGERAKITGTLNGTTIAVAAVNPPAAQD